jgi:hypothetical protein
MLHWRLGGRGEERRRRLRRRRQRATGQGRRFGRGDENSGRYAVQIFAGGRSKTVEASLGASINLGEIMV